MKCSVLLQLWPYCSQHVIAASASMYSNGCSAVLACDSCSCMCLMFACGT
jgi:hypothetical protein